jgi:superoxide dismutase, Fe-Mn family
MKSNHSRRDFLRLGSLFAAGSFLAPLFSRGSVLMNTVLAQNIEFHLLPLTYAYDALEPYIDKDTMQIHHSKHHQAYVNNLNKAIADGKLGNVTLEEMLAGISRYQPAVRNNAGGHFNHTLFWSLLHPVAKNYVPGSNAASGKLADAIKTSFGSFEEFKKQFAEKSKSVFGSGWCWLVVNKEKKLEIGTTPNQDNPMMDISPLKGSPVLCLDVWEHAYYLKYQNKRADYVEAWWNLVDWEEANRNYTLSKK